MINKQNYYTFPVKKKNGPNFKLLKSTELKTGKSEPTPICPGSAQVRGPFRGDVKERKEEGGSADTCSPHRGQRRLCDLPHTPCPLLPTLCFGKQPSPGMEPS